MSLCQSICLYFHRSIREHLPTKSDGERSIIGFVLHILLYFYQNIPVAHVLKLPKSASKAGQPGHIT